MVCETEKRIRVNNLKNAFFERFVSSQDGGQLSLQNGFAEAGGPAKLLKKYQRFCLSDQCLADELKFIAVCEMILEANKALSKKKKKQPGQPERQRAPQDLDDLALKSTQKGTIDSYTIDAGPAPAILRDHIKIL